MPDLMDNLMQQGELKQTLTEPAPVKPIAATPVKQRYIASVLQTDPGDLTDFLDFPKVRKNLYDNTVAAVKTRFPLFNDKYSLSVEDVDYDDPEDFSLQDQKKALMEGKSLGRRLRGSWVLRDIATDKVISKTPRKTLLKVPYLTERGTFIKSGSEYTFSNILRMQPGVYTKKRDDEISAQFNPRQGSGTRVNMVFTPSTGLFKMQKGTQNAPAYTILHDYGISDEAMEKAWGSDLFKLNRDAAQDQRARAAADKFYNDRD